MPTRLFLDPDFDGEPVVIYEPGIDDAVVPPDDGGKDGATDRSESGDERGDGAGGITREPRAKYVLENVAVGAGIERTQFLDENGRLITEEYRVQLRDEKSNAACCGNTRPCMTS